VLSISPQSDSRARSDDDVVLELLFVISKARTSILYSIYYTDVHEQRDRSVTFGRCPGSGSIRIHFADQNRGPRITSWFVLKTMLE